MTKSYVDLQVDEADDEVEKSISLRVKIVNLDEISDDETCKRMNRLLAFVTTLGTLIEHETARKMRDRVRFEIDQLERITIEAKDRQRDLVAVA